MTRPCWRPGRCAACERRSTALVEGLCPACRSILALSDREVQAICDGIELERLERELWPMRPEGRIIPRLEEP